MLEKGKTEAKLNFQIKLSSSGRGGAAVTRARGGVGAGHGAEDVVTPATISHGHGDCQYLDSSGHTGHSGQSNYQLHHLTFLPG